MTASDDDRAGVRVAAREATSESTPAGRSRVPDASLLLSGLALALVVVAGSLSLALPFWGDQALFAVYGRQLGDGAVLYRDLFDVKQPGIFYFFALGGLLFGFTEVGIHLFELLYLLAFSLFAIVVLRPYFESRWAAPAVPVLTVAVYYLYAQVNDLTQIEILVGFPILAAWWLIHRTDARTHPLGRYATAGLLTAGVVVLKYPYALIILGFLGYAVLRSRRQSVPVGDISRAVGAFSVGFLVPLLIVVAYFAVHGQLGRIWWAYFEYAPGATSLVPRDLGFLTGSARRFLVGHGPIILLAALGVVHVIRRRVRPQLELVVGMSWWIAVGAVLFYVQLWAEYKWLLFTVPVGILAVFGVEALTAMVRDLAITRRPGAIAAVSALVVLSYLLASPLPRTQTRLLLLVAVGVAAGLAAELLTGRPAVRRRSLALFAAALAVSVGLMAISPTAKLRALGDHDFALTTEARDEFQRSWYPPYRSADEDLQVLRSGDALPGPLYVLGHPVLVLRAGRPQAIPMLGWAYEVHDSRAWQELHRDLRSTMPPYIVIDDHAAPFVASRHPALLDFVESEYDVAFVGASGTWHVRRR